MSIDPAGAALDREELDEPDLLAYRPFRALEKVLGLVVGIVFSAVVLGIAANVIGRYVFSASIPWLGELVRFEFIWAAFLGAVLADLRGEHVALHYVVERCPSGLRLVASLLRLGVSAALFGLLLWGGWRLAATGTRTAPLLDIPMSWVSASVPVAAGLLLVLTLARLALILSPGRDGGRR